MQKNDYSFSHTASRNISCVSGQDMLCVDHWKL